MKTELYPRSLDVAEPRPAYLQSGIGLEGNTTNLGADMLAFTIAIRPDEEDSGTPGL